MVLVTISGKAGPTTFDRKLAFAEFYDDSDGWRLDDWVVDWGQEEKGTAEDEMAGWHH